MQVVCRFSPFLLVLLLSFVVMYQKKSCAFMFCSRQNPSEPQCSFLLEKDTTPFGVNGTPWPIEMQQREGCMTNKQGKKKERRRRRKEKE
jgi:hypothetical protein